MASPTPSTDSLGGGLGELGLSLTAHGSSSSSTCSSIVFPNLGLLGGLCESPKCGLCGETFTRPKVLPCFHTFCQECLEKRVDGSGRLCCPSCRHEFLLGGPQAVLFLFPDFGIKPPGVACKMCTTGASATAVCSVCISLCFACVRAHTTMHCFATHSVRPLSHQSDEDGAQGKEPLPCSQHKDEPMLFFCTTCAIPACHECLALDHPKATHDSELLADCEQKYVEDLSHYVHEFRLKSLNLHDILKRFEASSARLHSQYMKAQAEVNETFNFYRTLIEERKEELIKELDSLYTTRQLALSVLTKRVQETLDRMYQTVEFGDRLLRNAAPPQILLFKKLLETRLQALLASVPEQLTPTVAAASGGELEFVANFSAMQAGVRNTLGYIRSGVNLDAVGGTKVPPAPIARPISDNGFNNNGSGENMLSKRIEGPFNDIDCIKYDAWSTGCPDTGERDLFRLCSGIGTFPVDSPTDPVLDLTAKLGGLPKSPSMKRQKMIYHCKFGEFGTAEAQFTEPSGVAVNGNNEIIVADTNNHRIQIFDREGRFKFQFGECGKRDGQLLYPNRVAVVRPSGDIVVTERSPTHQIQIYNQYGQFVRKFGANILQHPRGVAVDNKGRVIVVECKVMRVIIFDQTGSVIHKFGCSKHLEFPNGVVVNERQEIFISDNRAHCVKVFSYEGTFLRQIGGEGLTNYPIGVGINAHGEILVADNHNNFNLTIFTQDGSLVSALESKVKHAQCFDVALMDEGSVVLASKDYRLYIYRYTSLPSL